MAYKGQSVTITLGQDGLFTDESQGRIPYTALTDTRNVTLERGVVEKAPGSVRWNVAALPSGIVALSDWWPDDVRQRRITVTRAGKMYKHHDALSYTELTAVGSAPAALLPGFQPTLIAGGAESGGRPRKLFAMTGNNQVQVLTADGATRSNIAQPALDWTTSYPTTGVIHHGRFCAIGNRTSPHTLYLSNPADHEDFQTSGAFLFFQVFPGEGEGLHAMHVYKSRLFLFKKPFGVYYLDDTDPTPTNWQIRKIAGGFGCASYHSAISVLDDMLVASNTGSVFSAQATNAFGDITSGDVLRAARNSQYMRQVTSQEGNVDRQAIYYEAKQQALFTYRSASGIKNDMILYLDFNDPNRVKTYWSDRDQANCLALIKDYQGVLRPSYGADDGYVYDMDRPDRAVNGVGYRGMFQTPFIDFGFVDPGLTERIKNFDFLELSMERLGDWGVNVEVYIDDRYIETIAYKQNRGAALDHFVLDRDRLAGRTSCSYRIPLHGCGRRIMFRVSNSVALQSFVIVNMVVYFRVDGDNQFQ